MGRKKTVEAAPTEPAAAELERVTQLLSAATWTFARTMPDNPHWYTLRKKWVNDQDFIDVVLFIRKHGVGERYPDPVKGKRYTVMVIDGHKYWTMGCPVHPDPDFDRNRNTILINRKPHPDNGPTPTCTDRRLPI